MDLSRRPRLPQPPRGYPTRYLTERSTRNMLTILLIIVLILLLAGGGFGYSRRGRGRL